MTLRLLTPALALASALLMLPAPAQARDWQVVDDASRIEFTTRYEGEAFTGQFKQFEADIRYDPKALDQARFDVTIDTGSVDTQSRMRDQVLAGENFFATQAFASAHFVTRSFERKDDGSVVAHGTLSLHGIDQPVTLQVDFQPTAEGATLEVRTAVERLDFKLGVGDDWAGIAKQVDVHATLTLH